MATSKSKEYRKELADMFANLLEEKELDWKKEWKGLSNRPVNARKERPYKGINSFRLMLIMMERGYDDPRWATFNQIKEMGCTLHDAKGMGVRVEYWFPYDKKERRALTWDEFKILAENKLDDRYVLHSRYSTVFNAAHIEGLPEKEAPAKNEVAIDELVNTLSANMGVEILNDGGDNAFYRPTEDKIHLPEPKAFDNDYAYNSTAMHELAHSTGAAHRLNRKLLNPFGSEGYAFEELVAEITSCFVSVNFNMEQDSFHIDNHKAYVQNWVSVIREKPEALVKAIEEAEKAASYMEYKAELIPEQEFMQVYGSSFTVSEQLIYDSFEPSPADMVAERSLSNITENNIENHYELLESAGYEKVPERQEEKVRLLVDMDGTAAVFKSVDTLETLYEQGYFLNLEPNENVVAAIKQLVNEYPEIEVFIMSSVLSDSKYALDEKNAWLDKYLPEIDASHRIFPPCGENKLDYVPGGILVTDHLLDDYTHNLTLWEPPAKAIKLLNGINHTNGTWNGNMIRYDKSPDEIVQSVVDILVNQKLVQDLRPQDEPDYIRDMIDEIKAQQENTLNEIQNINSALDATVPKFGTEVKLEADMVSFENENDLEESKDDLVMQSVSPEQETTKEALPQSVRHITPKSPKL